MNRLVKQAFYGAAIASSVALVHSEAQAQAPAKEAPRSWVASPGVYKVIGQNAQYRIILATWKPGQIDKPHSHKAGTTVTLTDCETRNHPTGAAPVDRPPRKAGDVLPLTATPSHQNENVGKAVCQIVLIEMK
ncbi:MAG TPA: hypothetical protein VN802_08390 [Stellaceae bacterium]|nr:hypothetical protein [Stellaceae bacterium]